MKYIMYYILATDHTAPRIDWCATDGARQIFYIAKLLLSGIRIIVPIGLIVMTAIDIFKNVINPESKDGQKKILNRLISAIVVFFVPVLVSFVMRLVEIGIDGDDKTSEKVKEGSCWDSWENAEYYHSNP